MSSKSNKPVETNEDAKPEVATKKCETCDGRGIRPEVSTQELCSDCNGNGTVEA